MTEREEQRKEVMELLKKGGKGKEITEKMTAYLKRYCIQKEGFPGPAEDNEKLNRARSAYDDFTGPLLSGYEKDID